MGDITLPRTLFWRCDGRIVRSLARERSHWAALSKPGVKTACQNIAVTQAAREIVVFYGRPRPESIAPMLA